MQWLTCFKHFSKSLVDDCPRIELATMVLAKDLELPGFPTRNNGILSSMHTVIMKTFSRRAAFFAMLGPKTILSSSAS